MNRSSKIFAFPGLDADLLAPPELYYHFQVTPGLDSRLSAPPGLDSPLLAALE